MPRAHRYYLPGHVWHITHRCHKRDFLLKFSKDRQRWRYWLFEAKKRYGLCVLNYTITSNHIHLLVRDGGKGEIAKSMQLVAGRTAQEYNHRKKRQGAFWEDRYHATAVDSDSYLAQCMVYIDLNMVRAGVISQPADWPWSGYCEIQYPPKRYTVIDQSALIELSGANSFDDFQRVHKSWVDHALSVSNLRDPTWTQNIAIGNREFIDNVKSSLGITCLDRVTVHPDNRYVLKESAIPYSVHSAPKKSGLSAKNTGHREK